MTKRLIAIFALAAALAACTPGSSPSPAVQSPAVQSPAGGSPAGGSPAGMESPGASGMESPAGSAEMESASPS